MYGEEDSGGEEDGWNYGARIGVVSPVGGIEAIGP